MVKCMTAVRRYTLPIRPPIKAHSGVVIYDSLRLTPRVIGPCCLPSFLRLLRDIRHNMATLLLRLTAAFLVVALVVGDASEEFDFDFDGLPGVNHEFKVEVRAGSRQCFYQSMKEDAYLQVAFHVGIYHIY